MRQWGYSFGAFVLLAIVLYFTLGCAKPAVFSNGDKADVREVLEPDMAKPEQE